MMKFISRGALVAAVATLAMAGSSSDTFARGHKKMAKPVACAPAWALKTNACANGLCSMQRCWPDGKWQASMAMCWQPWCPK